MNNDIQARWLVCKFGGSSVRDLARWQRIEQIVRAHLRKGRRVVLVCSAVRGVTDELERLADAVAKSGPIDSILERVADAHERLTDELGLSPERTVNAELRALIELCEGAGPAARGTPSLRARIVSAGEAMSTRIGAEWLRRRGLRARWLDAQSILRSVDAPHADEAERYLSARCAHDKSAVLQARLGAMDEEVLVTQGFVGRNAAGETVLLGRGGSDTSGAYIASLLEAEALQIWTDVPGMFTIDPRRKSDARMLRALSYAEAAVHGAMGAKVLHPRCLAPIGAANVPLEIGWTEHPEIRGTRIGSEARTTPSGIKAVSTRGNLCMVRMRRERSWQPIGFLADVSECFRAHGLSIDLLSSSPSEIRATIDLSAFPGAADRLDALARSLSEVCEPELVRDIACVSLLGHGLDRSLDRVGEVLRHFGSPEVHLVSHAADGLHVSYVVDASLAQDLAAAVHDSIFEGEPDGAVFGPTWASLKQTGSAPLEAASA